MKGEAAIYVNEGFTMTVESPARHRSEWPATLLARASLGPP
jgi:hypothetical protein